MIKLFVQIFLAVFFLPFSSMLAGTGEGVRAELFSDAPVPLVAGKPFMATVVLDLQPGWHTYWQYPGDAGIATKVEWHLPLGWKAEPIEFSVPDQFSEPGDLIIYGYEKQSLLRAKIIPPKDLPRNQTVELKATVSWLACKELCVPGSAELSSRLLGSTDGSSKGASGDHGISLNVAKGVWPEKGEPGFPVSIANKESSIQVSFSGEQGAAYELFPDPGTGTTVGHVSGTISGEKRTFTIPWQGGSPFHALLLEKKGDVKKAWWIGGLSSGAREGTSSGGRLSWGVLLAALFSGFLGGLILNLMPCVLPVISLKIFSFISQAGESPSRILRHGLAFAAGIFIWFLGLGVLVILLKLGGSQVTWGAFQFQNPLFVVFLSVLVFLFALNLFGVFEITLHNQAGASIDSATSRDGYSGSFFQGLFATLLATPCTAPFLGSALGFAFGQSPAVILGMFAAVALGMSLPYLLLSARPGWRSWIPKPGVWMERLKQFMGFPLLATNLWLLWVLESQRGAEATLALLLLLLVLGFCAWGYGILSNGVNGRFASFLLLLIFLLAGSSIFLLAKFIRQISPLPAASKNSMVQDEVGWVPYSPASLDSLRAEGRPVFLDFTATWCLTCQFNERTAINVPAVRKLLQERGITAMKGDWTNADPAITSALKSFARVGVPLAVYYPPGKGSVPVVLPELLTEKIVLDALGRN